jgi:hypothetical protein
MGNDFDDIFSDLPAPSEKENIFESKSSRDLTKATPSNSEDSDDYHNHLPDDCEDLSDCREWKIMVVDDEEGVHAVTKMVLRNFPLKKRKCASFMPILEMKPLNLFRSNQILP